MTSDLQFRECADRAEQGFSLLELLVVLAVLAAATAIAVPYVAKPPAAVALQRHATELVAVLRQARTTAIAGNTEVTVAVNVEERWIEVSQPPRRLEYPAGMSLSVTSARQLLQRDAARLVFGSDGSSSGGAITIALEGAERTIAVDWLTGTAQLRVRVP